MEMTVIVRLDKGNNTSCKDVDITTYNIRISESNEQQTRPELIASMGEQLRWNI